MSERSSERRSTKCRCSVETKRRSTTKSEKLNRLLKKLVQVIFSTLLRFQIKNLRQRFLSSAERIKKLFTIKVMLTRLLNTLTVKM